MQMCVSEVRLVDYTRLLGRQGDLTAELFHNFCVLALLCAVCAMPECSVFWHHGVQCVGMLADRAPQGSNC